MSNAPDVARCRQAEEPERSAPGRIRIETDEVESVPAPDRLDRRTQVTEAHVDPVHRPAALLLRRARRLPRERHGHGVALHALRRLEEVVDLPDDERVAGTRRSRDEIGAAWIRMSQGGLDKAVRTRPVRIPQASGLARSIGIEERVEMPSIDRRLSSGHVGGAIERNVGVLPVDLVADPDRDVDGGRVDTDAWIVGDITGLVRRCPTPAPPAHCRVPPVDVPAVGGVLVHRDGQCDD